MISKSTLMFCYSSSSNGIRQNKLFLFNPFVWLGVSDHFVFVLLSSWV
ncbi:hypothetical protein F383_33496 [Gossypium arboreum]|uniref:Uncharacterized protein n=1 Tax=Gossypium arboreum TaxID=29729 RepID=A0A0B0N510_GOSAR|nr:hypothetical protein F383_33496 [Gossypium arboreum]